VKRRADGKELKRKKKKKKKRRREKEKKKKEKIEALFEPPE